MKPQRLSVLSRIKAQRENRARLALQTCLARLAAAQRAALAAVEREKTAAARMKRNRSDLYGSILGRPLSLAAIERVNQKVLEMERESRRLAEAARAAERRVLKIAREAEAARRAYARRRMEVQKWNGLEERVQAEFRQAASRLAEVELEGELSDRWRGGHLEAGDEAHG